MATAEEQRLQRVQRARMGSTVNAAHRGVGMNNLTSILLKLGGAALLAAAPDKAWRLLTVGAVERITLRGDVHGLAGTVARYLESVATVLWRPHAPRINSHDFDRRRQKYVDTPVELVYQRPTLYLYRRAPLLISWFRSKTEEGGIESGFELAFARGSVNSDQLLIDACEHSRGQNESEGQRARFTINERSGRGFVGKLMSSTADASSPPCNEGKYMRLPDRSWLAPVRYIEGSEADYGPLRQKLACRWMYWSAEAQRLRDDAKRWLGRRAWCLERGIPWRRGLMLYGPPGNGKTLLAYAIAEELDIPLYSLDISAMSSEDFASAWREAQSDAPAMVLIEDFDATIRGRENVKSREHGVGFETVLNCLAGVSRAGGVLFIMTTNDHKSVDPALCSLGKDDEESRPGRIDLAVEITPPSRDARLSIARRILKDERIARELADCADGVSIGQFQERCYRLADG